MHLSKNEINDLINKKDLIIRPLLNPSEQINDFSIDFRLGYDFLVPIQGRYPSINITLNLESPPPSSLYDETRRKLAENFLLHPGQTVLTTSLEYIKLPSNIYAIINIRSSYARFGLSLSTLIQPGFCGCIPFELTNNNKNPILLTVGSCIIQACFIKLQKSTNYFNKKRKNYCNVRPIISDFIYDDHEINFLKFLFEKENNIITKK